MVLDLLTPELFYRCRFLDIACVTSRFLMRGKFGLQARPGRRRRRLGSRSEPVHFSAFRLELRPLGRLGRIGLPSPQRLPASRVEQFRYRPSPLLLRVAVEQRFISYTNFNYLSISNNSYLLFCLLHASSNNCRSGATISGLSMITPVESLPLYVRIVILSS